MKKSLLPVLTILFFLTSTAFFIDNYVVKKNTAEVDQIQGVYVFAKCKPVQEYEHLGTVKGPKIGKHEFDNLVESMIKNVKKEYPRANAIIFDSAIRQTHNTTVSAVILK